MLPAAHPPFITLAWSRNTALLAGVLAVFFIALFIVGGVEFYRRFPDNYAWTDLLIGYSGGFVRRGLLGELAWQLRDVIAPQLLLAVLISAAYIATALWLVLLVCGNLTTAGIMFLASPATLTMAAYDFEAYGRKDIFIVAAFCLSVVLLRRVASPALTAFGLMAIYLVAGLIHELAWCYYPLAAMLLLVRERTRTDLAWKWGFIAASALYLAGCLLLVSTYRGGAAAMVAIVDSWQTVIPQAFAGDVKLGAVRFLDKTLSEGFAIYDRLLGARNTAAYYVVAFALALLPIGLYLPGRGLARHFPDALTRLALLGALLAVLASFAIAYDWGRMIYLAVIHLFICVAVLQPTPAPSPVPLARVDLRKLGYALALVALYAVTWRVRHAAPLGTPLFPGTLFRLFPS